MDKLICVFKNNNDLYLVFNHDIRKKHNITGKEKQTDIYCNMFIFSSESSRIQEKIHYNKI